MFFSHTLLYKWQPRVREYLYVTDCIELDMHINILCVITLLIIVTFQMQYSEESQFHNTF